MGTVDELRPLMATAGAAASQGLSESCRVSKQGGGKVLDNRWAMDQFLASVERRAFRMARIATGNDDEALDIVQDAMLGLVQRYGDRGPDDWPPLFHRILQSRINDWHRRGKVRRRWRVWLDAFRRDDEPEGPDPIARFADPVLGPEGELDQRAAMEALEHALGSLPLRQQQAFVLRVWEGMDVAETAEAMGCSQGSVKTHFSRAVHTLRGLLEGFEP